MPRTVIADVDRLRPHLVRLASLDGAILSLADGVHLASVVGLRARERLVREPSLVLDAALVTETAELARPLVRVDAAWLSAAYRALAILEESGYRQALARRSPVLRRVVAPAQVDRRWLATRKERLAALARLVRSPAAPLTAEGLLALAPSQPPPAPPRDEDPFPERWDATSVLEEPGSERARSRLRSLLGCLPVTLDVRFRQALGVAFSTPRNRSLLLELLRDAALRPGEPVARCRERNRRWIARAAGHLDVEAWLSHREQAVEIEGRPFTLATEEDPLEALRLGNPFNTCLSLDRKGLGPGANAAAAVLFALEANQRVVFLRNARGNVVARQRLAIGADFALLGYRIYSSLPAQTRPAVESAFRAFAEALARDVRAPLADAGTPEPILEGFRWEEKPVPFSGKDAAGALARYARHLGFPVTDEMYLLPDEAVGFAAREDGDAEAGYRAQEHLYQRGPFWTVHGDWVLARLGREELARRARADCDGRIALFRDSARRSAAEVVEAMARTQASWCTWRDGPGWVLRSRATPGAAAAWVKLARRCGPARGYRRDAILEGTLAVMPWLLRAEDPAARRALEADLADLWRRSGRRRSTSPPPALVLDPGPWPEARAFTDPALRKAAAEQLAPRVSEPLLVQLGLEAERAGADAGDLVRETLAAAMALSPLQVGWVGAIELPETLPPVEDAALAAGPTAALAVLSALPDFESAARFVNRVADRYAATGLSLPLARELDDPSDALRLRWLRLALLRRRGGGRG